MLPYPTYRLSVLLSSTLSGSSTTATTIATNFLLSPSTDIHRLLLFVLYFVHSTLFISFSCRQDIYIKGKKLIKMRNVLIILKGLSFEKKTKVINIHWHWVLLLKFIFYTNCKLCVAINFKLQIIWFETGPNNSDCIMISTTFLFLHDT